MAAELVTDYVLFVDGNALSVHKSLQEAQGAAKPHVAANVPSPSNGALLWRRAESGTTTMSFPVGLSDSSVGLSTRT